MTQNNNYSKNNNDKMKIGGKTSPSGVRVGGAIVDGGSVGGAVDEGGSVGGAIVVEGAVGVAMVVGCLVVGAIVVGANYVKVKATKLVIKSKVTVLATYKH